MTLAEFNKALSKVFQEQVEMTPKITIKDESVSVSTRAFVPHTKSHHATVCTAKFSKEAMSAVKSDDQMMRMMRTEDVRVHTACWGVQRTKDYYKEYDDLLIKVRAIASEDPCEDAPKLSNYDKAICMLTLLLHSLAYWETSMTVLVMALGNIAQTSGCEENRTIATAIIKSKIEGAYSNIEATLSFIRHYFPTISLTRKSFDVPK